MTTFFQSVRQGFTRTNTKSQQNLKAGLNGSSSNSPTNTTVPPLPTMTQSPSMSSTYSNSDTMMTDGGEPKRFLNEKYAKCSVKGNFLTLAAQPKNVELGEWLAHQLVEMNRLLHGMIQVIQEIDMNTGMAICNEHTCPTMSAGRLTYTWLENGRPAKIPAPSYITRVQKWIVGKIHDPNIFPTDPPPEISSTAFLSGDTNPYAPSSTPSPSNLNNPNNPIPLPPTTLHDSLSTLSGTNPSTEHLGRSSGFPAHYHADVKSIIKQMFRCYAHLYHNHWDNPFWHINRHLELNSCFVHFITVAMYYDLLPRKDMEPLQGLVDIFVGQGVVPREAVVQHVG